MDANQIITDNLIRGAYDLLAAGKKAEKVRGQLAIVTDNGMANQLEVLDQSLSIYDTYTWIKENLSPNAKVELLKHKITIKW